MIYSVALSRLSALVPLRALVRESQNGLSKRTGESGTELPVLRLGDIHNGEIDESEPRSIKLTEKEVTKYQLLRGDLLCIRVNGSKGLVGRMIPFTSPRAWAYCDHFIRLRPDPDKADFRYLAYYLNSSSVRRILELSMVSSAGQHTVSQGTVLELEVPLLPLDDQRAVVAEIEKQFSRLDKAVANLKRVKANLQHLRAATISSAMQGTLLEDETPAQQSLPTAGDLADCPRGWKTASIGDVAAETLVGLDRGRDQQSNTSPGLPYVKMKNVTMNGEVEAVNLVFVEASATEVTRYLLREGDILFNTRNSKELVGKTGLVSKALEGALYNNNLMRIRTSKAMLPAFLCMQMCSRDFRRRLEPAKKATTSVAAVYLRDLRPLSVVVPPLAEQHRIVAEVDRRLSIVRGVEAEVDANLKRAQALRQAVLAKAFALP